MWKTPISASKNGHGIMAGTSFTGAADAHSSWAPEAAEAKAAKAASTDGI